jgi:carboxylesterase
LELFCVSGVCLLMLCIQLGVMLALLPLRPLTSRTQPVADYDEALARITALQARDTDIINPVCRTQLLTHGRRVERVIVMLHGYTNCPQQFVRLGQQFYERGCNVLIPRIPHHGFTDRLTDELKYLTAETLVTFTDEVIDSAHGLGERVTVMGLSLSGTLTLWAALQRADVERAVAIAPFIAPHNAPVLLMPTLARLWLLLPNLLVWWDSKLKAAIPGPPHAYPRIATRSVAHLMRIVFAIAEATRQGAKPRAHSLMLIINAADPAVDNAPTKAIIERWRANGATQIETYEFDASLKLIHDIIDEQQPQQRTELVYPLIIERTLRADPKGS